MGEGFQIPISTSLIVARLRHWRHFPRTGGSHSTLHPPRANPITPPMSAQAPAKRLFIKTYGCQMNVYDSERMADVLSPLGYAMTDTPQGADLVVLAQDPFKKDPSELLTIQVERTMVGGRWKYES